MTTKPSHAPWFSYPNFAWDKQHAVVIGAGIAGCQIAWHLVKQGWQVTLIEREHKPAQQASGNPAGIISPKMTAQASNGEDFYVSCFDYAIRQLAQLKTRQPNLDWHACGLLQLAHNSREEQRWDSLANRNFDPQFLQLTDQQQSSDIAGIPLNYKASYFPQAGWINPVSFCESLLADCADGCELILATDVINLHKDENAEKAKNEWLITDNKQKLIAHAEAVIISSGKDLNQFEQSQHLPAMPVAGQTTSAPNNNFAKQLKTTLGHEGYLTPASQHTSQLTFGASFERNVDSAKLNTQTDQKNLQQLRKYLPQLADSFTDTQSAHIAIRMTTPDRFPYLGAIADHVFYQQHYADLHQGKQFKNYPEAKYTDGLFVLAGLGSRGLTSSGLCAKALSDIISNSTQHEYKTLQEQCHPARFIIKDLKRNRP